MRKTLRIWSGLNHDASEEEIIDAARALGFPKFVPTINLIMRVPLDASGIVTVESEIRLSTAGNPEVTYHTTIV